MPAHARHLGLEELGQRPLVRQPGDRIGQGELQGAVELLRRVDRMARQPLDHAARADRVGRGLGQQPRLATAAPLHGAQRPIGREEEQAQVERAGLHHPDPDAQGEPTPPRPGQQRRRHAPGPQPPRRGEEEHKLVPTDAKGRRRDGRRDDPGVPRRRLAQEGRQAREQAIGILAAPPRSFSAA